MGFLFGGGGGGSSGGGGTTNQNTKIDYPDYMKSWHGTMLSDVYNLIQSAATPPTTYLYDPKIWFGVPTPGASVFKLLTAFQALDIPALFKEVISDTYQYAFVLGESAVAAIKAKAVELRDMLVDPAEADQACNDMIDAHATKVLQKINEDALPKVDIGMRDLNAVVGTSFVIARELAMEDYIHEVADFSAKARMRVWELRHELYKFVEATWVNAADHVADTAMKRVAMVMEHSKLEVSMAAEVANVAVLAQSKYGVVQTEQEARDKTWKLDLYTDMNKSLAAISGAATTRQGESKSAALFTGLLGFGSTAVGIGGYLAKGLGLLGAGGGAAGASAAAGTAATAGIAGAEAAGAELASLALLL